MDEPARNTRRVGEMRVLIDALILAGGAGRRMKGRDKGLVELSGRPLIEWVIEALLQQQETRLAHVLVAANRNLADYARFGYPVLRDVYPGMPGPLAGVHSALLASPCQALLVVPVDAPFLPRDLLHRMQLALSSQQAPAVVARCGGVLVPTVCLISRAVQADLIEHLAGGDFLLAPWLQSIGAVPVDFPAGSIANVNSFDDLGLLAARLAGVEAISLPPASSGMPVSGQCRAQGELCMQPDTLRRFEAGMLDDVLGLARAAGLLAAKRASELIPQLPPQAAGLVHIEFLPDPLRCALRCQVQLNNGGEGSGVAALLAVQLALLTLYEACHAEDRTLRLDGVQLLDALPVRASNALDMPLV